MHALKLCPRDCSTARRCSRRQSCSSLAPSPTVVAVASEVVEVALQVAVQVEAVEVATRLGARTRCSGLRRCCSWAAASGRRLRQTATATATAVVLAAVAAAPTALLRARCGCSG